MTLFWMVVSAGVAYYFGYKKAKKKGQRIGARRQRFHTVRNLEKLADRNGLIGGVTVETLQDAAIQSPQELW